MEGSWLEAFEGQHVTVVTGAENERSDIGTLVRIDSGWLQLIKDNGEMLLIPSTAIRIVKLLNMTQSAAAVEREISPHIATRIYEPPVETLP